MQTHLKPALCRAWRGAARAVAVALLALLFTGAVVAGRPLVTEDAAVQANGECTLDSYWARVRSGDDGTPRTLSSQFTCGGSWQTQWAVGYSDSRLGADTTRSLLLAGKTALIEPRDDGPGLSIAYGAPAERAAGSPTRIGDVFATLAGTLPVGTGLLLHGNLGWTGSHPSASNTTRWALAFEQVVGQDLHLVAETFADDHDHRPWLQAGVSTALGERLSINASYGRQVRGAGAQAITLGFVVGF